MFNERKKPLTVIFPSCVIIIKPTRKATTTLSSLPFPSSLCLFYFSFYHHLSLSLFIHFPEKEIKRKAFSGFFLIGQLHISLSLSLSLTLLACFISLVSFLRFLFTNKRETLSNRKKKKKRDILSLRYGLVCNFY